MTEDEIHHYIDAEWKRQRPEPGSPGYKNRNHIQAKLPDELYRKAWAYCKQHGLSFNSLTRTLHERFFSQNHV
jgi:hypothetical protein